MKNIIFFCMVWLLFGVSLNAQTDTTKVDTVQKVIVEEKVEIENQVEEEIEEEVEDSDWEFDWEDDDDDSRDKSFCSNDVRIGMLDIGTSGYLFDDNFNLPEELSELDLLYGRSININWHLIRNRLYFIKRNVSLEYGLSLSWMQYRFANNFLIDEKASTFETEPLEGDYKKNNLRTTFIEIPLMLTISDDRSKFFVSGGGYAGLMIGSRQKLKTDGGNKTKIKDDFNLNNFRYGLEGRIGIGPISVYAQCSLVPLFKDDRGPELTPINIGLALLNF